MKNLKTSLICLICILIFSHLASGQQAKQEETQPLAKVLSNLTLRYKVNFLYEEIHIKQKKVIYNPEENKGKSITQILNTLILPLNLSWYKVDEQNYSIFPTPAKITPGKSMDIKAVHQDSTRTDQVSGQILDENKKPLEYTTVTLLVAADSTFVLNALTDLSGNFTFPSVKPGTYKIRVSSIGHNAYTTEPFTVGGSAPVSIAPIAMQSSGETLKEVKITASRPLVETRSDGLVLNVDNSAMAIGNSLQLLKSAPFVRVSADNSVSLQGKRTMVLIDSKPVPDASLENILQTMPAGNISKIQLITQPSAKYDASYGAVINIITKKSQIEGITGNLRADASSGHYASGNTNASVTYKRKSLTLYASGSLNKGNSFFGINSERYQDPTDPLYFISNNWKRISHNNIYSFQASADLQIDKNQTVGLFVDAANYRIKGPWTTTNEFGRKNIQLDSVLYTDADFNLKLSSYNYNLNYRLLSDSGKNELTVLATFTPWKRDMLQYFPSALYNSSGEVIKTPAVYQMRNKGNINVWIAQTDYTHQFDHQWKLETGFKYQNTDSKTSVGYEDNRNGSFEQVPAFSNNNNLKETISAAYGIITKDWKNDKLQLGLRLENTSANFAGNFKQSYSNFFPNFLYQHNINKDINLSASYKRTISRAPYNELVPYTVFVNQYTIEQGNPALVPEFDHVYSINANIHKLNLSLTYTSAKGLIGLFPVKQDYETKVTYYRRQNLKNSSDISLYLFYPYQINEWWETLNSGTPIGYNKAEGTVLGQQYKLGAIHSDFKTSHIFKLSKNLKLQVDAYYWTDYVQDLSHNSGNKNIDASFLLNVWEGKGQFRLGGSELVFKRNDYLIERDYGTFHSAELVNTDSKRIFFGFSYKFGKSRIQKSDTKLGNEDAMKRL